MAFFDIESYRFIALHCPHLLWGHGVVSQWSLHPSCIYLTLQQVQGSLLPNTMQHVWHCWTLVCEILLLAGVEFVIQHHSSLPATSWNPSKRVWVLCFKQLDGFKVHQDKDALEDSSHKRHHLKIQSNTFGQLQISKKSYTAAKVHQGNQTSDATTPVALCCNQAVDVPNPTDSLPDCVDLSILNDGPRPCLMSVSGGGLHNLSLSKCNWLLYR